MHNFCKQSNLIFGSEDFLLITAQDICCTITPENIFELLPSSAQPQLVASFSFAGRAELALFLTNPATPTPTHPNRGSLCLSPAQLVASFSFAGRAELTLLGF